MHIILSTILALATLTTLGGCFSVRADVPADAVRQHMAREEGIELGAICSHEGQAFSEGAAVCMAGQRMACGATARWTPAGDCGKSER